MPARGADSGRRAASPARPGCLSLAAGTAILIALVLLLPACASLPSQTDSSSSTQQAQSALLDELAVRLTGDYASVQSRHSGTQQQLLIRRHPGSEAGHLGLLLSQRATDGGPDRHFGLQFRPGELETRLDAILTLLDENQRPRRSCSMVFHVAAARLVGETDPAQCLFGSEEQQVGLLKEIAFDGQQLSIADRVVNPWSGEALGEDQVIHFLPAPVYGGWAGVRDGDGWRIGRGYQLQPGQAALELVDAARMSLGIQAQLAYYRMAREDGRILLRLTVSDSQSKQVLAEAWAEPGSASLGLAGPGLQLGMNQVLQPSGR